MEARETPILTHVIIVQRHGTYCCGHLTDYREHGSTMDDASGSSTPKPEEKAAFEAARKELVQALAKKRAVDKQLVRPFVVFKAWRLMHIYSSRRNWKFKYTITKGLT